MDTIIIGDIHGCLTEFDEILKLADHKSPNVRIICVGDFIDRGPDSLGVVRRAKELKLEGVRANHEDRLFKWLDNKKSRYQNCYSQFNEDDINYLKSLPYYIKLDDLLIVHAGIKPNISLEQQKRDDLINLRYTDENRNFISLRKIDKLGIQATNAKFWTEFGPFKTNVIYGHNVYSLSEIKLDKYDDGYSCYGIDTGCCFGGFLTAINWSTKELIQVKAKEVYYKPGFKTVGEK